MKRVLIIALALVLTFGGVAVAADTVAPTLADVVKAITELKADVAQLKADGFTKANTSGKLAYAETKDKLVTLEVTSLMAGPDATVVGVKVTNKTDDKHAMFSGEFSSTITAGGKQIKILTAEPSDSTVLPGTAKQFVLLTEPLPKDVKEITLRTKVIDEKAFSTLLQPELKITVAK